MTLTRSRRVFYVWDGEVFSYVPVIWLQLEFDKRDLMSSVYYKDRETDGDDNYTVNTHF
jgi:hypothetical protein